MFALQHKSTGKGIHLTSKAMTEHPCKHKRHTLPKYTLDNVVNQYSSWKRLIYNLIST